MKHDPFKRLRLAPPSARRPAWWLAVALLTSACGHGSPSRSLIGSWASEDGDFRYRFEQGRYEQTLEGIPTSHVAGTWTLEGSTLNLTPTDVKLEATLGLGENAKASFESDLGSPRRLVLNWTDENTLTTTNRNGITVRFHRAPG
jgi:hypothetical protein